MTSFLFFVLFVAGLLGMTISFVFKDKALRLACVAIGLGLVGVAFMQLCSHTCK